jgi:hypothetical protein
MKIIYRISDSGYKKIKPDYINNENCLKNFCNVFSNSDIMIIADNVCGNTYQMILQYIDSSKIESVSVGHGAGTFNLALNQALQYDNDEIIYFVENDYVHKQGSDVILKEGFDLGFSFVSLYDHPDKYKDPSNGGNPYCSGGSELTRLFLTRSSHWKLTNSTTMTFASKVSTLKRSERFLRKWTNINDYPHDFNMFLELRDNREFLITAVPGFCTHGETEFLAPFENWNEIVHI